MKLLLLTLLTLTFASSAYAQQRVVRRPVPPGGARVPAVPAAVPPSVNLTDAERVALVIESSNPECERSPGGTRNISTELYQAARQPGTTPLTAPAQGTESVR